MNVTTWVCFWLAVIGIAEVIQAHKPPVVIIQKDDAERGKDDTESNDIA